jgi:hypothetical protein
VPGYPFIFVEMQTTGSVSLSFCRMGNLASPGVSRDLHRLTAELGHYFQLLEGLAIL